MKKKCYYCKEKLEEYIEKYVKFFHAEPFAISWSTWKKKRFHPWCIPLAKKEMKLVDETPEQERKRHIEEAKQKYKEVNGL